MIKWVYSLSYRPVLEGYCEPVSVVMPIYHEDRLVLHTAISKVIAQPTAIVGEIIIVTDAREPDLKGWVETHFTDTRITVVETQKTRQEKFSPLRY